MRRLLLIFLLILSAATVVAENHTQETNLEALVAHGRDIVLGEIHGTVEIPALFLSLVEQALGGEEKVFVSLELSRKVRDLSRYSWSGIDGRHSKAMWQLVEELLALEDADKLQLHFQHDVIDPYAARWDKNEQRVGETLRRLAEQGQLMALVGNSHSARAARQGGALPAGFFVGEETVTVYVLPLGRFQAWACTRACGVQDFSRKPGDNYPFENLSAGKLYNGERLLHDYIYTITDTTASPPYTD